MKALDGEEEFLLAVDDGGGNGGVKGGMGLCSITLATLVQQETEGICTNAAILLHHNPSIPLSSHLHPFTLTKTSTKGRATNGRKSISTIIIADHHHNRHLSLLSITTMTIIIILAHHRHDMVITNASHKKSEN